MEDQTCWCSIFVLSSTSLTISISPGDLRRTAGSCDQWKVDRQQGIGAKAGDAEVKVGGELQVARPEGRDIGTV